MSKHWKRFAAVVVSLTMAFQFCVNDFYAYAETNAPEQETVEQTPPEQQTQPEPEVTTEPVETPAQTEPAQEPAPEVETETTTPPAEGEPAQEQTPAQPERETAGILKLEFKDEAGNTLKTVDPIALTNKVVGDTIRLTDLGVDTNVADYTLVDIKDKNDSTKDYSPNSVDFTLTKNITELQLVYRANPKEPETTPTENDTNTTEDSQQGEGEKDSEADADEADTKEEDSDEPKEEEEESEEEVNKPEAYLSVTASDGATITVFAPAGALPEGSSVTAVAIDSNLVKSTVKEAVESEGKQLLNYKAYDITIYDADGNVIQPSKAINVSITNSGVVGEKSVYHLSDSATSIEKISGMNMGSTQTFSTDHFSIYVVAGSEDIPEVEDVLRLTISFEYENGIIAGDTQVVEIPKSENQYNVEFDIPEKSGYSVQLKDEIAGLSIENNQLIGTLNDNASIQVTVQYVANTAPYKVEHRFQSLDGESYEKDDQYPDQQKDGKVGELTEAEALEVHGFTPQVIEQQEIVEGEDGEAVTVVTIKYDRNEYTLTFNTDGGSYVPSINAVYGTTIDLRDVSNPTKVGYRFNEWKTSDGQNVGNSIELTDDIILTASWNPQRVNYKIVYMTENADDDGYSYAGTVTKQALAGSTVTVNSQTEKPEGFDTKHFTYDKSQGNIQATIAPDGSTVITVRYTRNTYTITFEGTGGWQAVCGQVEHTHSIRNNCYTLTCTKEEHTHHGGIWDSCYNLWGELTCTKEEHSHSIDNGCYQLTCTTPEHTHNDDCYGYRDEITITAKYQQNIKDLWNAAVGPGTEYEGSNWLWDRNDDGNYYTGFQSTMPGEDKTISTGNSGSTQRELYYYIEDPNGGIQYNGKSFILYTTVVLKLQRDSSPTYNEEFFVIDGYERYGSTIEEWKDGENSYDGTGSWDRNGGGKFYYTYSDYQLELHSGSSTSIYDVPYLSDISHYLENPQSPSQNYDGEFKGWYLDPEFTYQYDGNNKMPKGLVLYAKWEKTNYTVLFKDIPSDEYEINDYSSQKVASGETITGFEPTKEGFKFAGWYYQNNDGEYVSYDLNMPVSADSPKTIYAKWTADKNTTYTVKYKFVNANGETVAEYESDPKSGLVGTTVKESAEKPEKLGTEFEKYSNYTVDKASSTITLKAGGSNVIEFVYTEATDLQYSIKYVDKNNPEIVLFDSTTQEENQYFTSQANQFVRPADKDIVDKYVLPKGYKLVSNSVNVVLTTDKDTNVAVYYCEQATYSIDYKGVEGTDYIQNGEGYPSEYNAAELGDGEAGLKIANPTKDGYIFEGWEFTSENGKVETEDHSGAKKDVIINKGSYGDLEFTAKFEKADIGYRVEYYLEDEDGYSDQADHTISGLTAKFESEVTSYPEWEDLPENYVVDKVENLPLTIGSDASQNVIKVYYSKDENGNEVPDKYDVAVTFKVEHGKFEEEKTSLTEYVAQKEWNNEQQTWVEIESPTLTEDQIPSTITADPGYDQDSGAWEDPKPDTTTVIKEATEYTYTFEKADIGYRVEYYLEDEDGYSDQADHTISGLTAKFESEVTSYPEWEDLPENYVVDKVENLPLTIGSDASQNVIKVYYSKDENGNEVPDKYDVAVTFKVEHGKFEEEKTSLTEYVAQKEWNNEQQTWVEIESPTLTEDQIPSTITADPGYDQDSGAWEDPKPDTTTVIKEATEYTYTFEKADIGYRVEYYLEDEDGYSDQADHTISGLTAKFESEVTSYPEWEDLPENYVVDKVENLPLTIGSDASQNVIKVYYSKDENGNEVPDKYDVAVTFKVEHGKFEEEKTSLTEYVAQKEWNNEQQTWVEIESPTLTEDQIPSTITADPGYDQDSGAWEDPKPDTTTVIKEATEYTYTFEKADIGYRVEYYLEDEDGYSDQADHTISGLTAKFESEVTSYPEWEDLPENYVVDKVENLPLTIGSDASQNVIKVYYSKDENGNEVPDKYDVAVTFKVEHGKFEEEKTSLTEYVAQKEWNNEQQTWVEIESPTLTEDQIPSTITADPGYDQDSGAWEDPKPDTTTVIKEATEYTYTFEKADIGYRVEYYLEDEDGYSDQADHTISGLTAKFESEVTSYPEWEDLPENYVVDKVENLPLTIGSDASQNVIKVYYSKDENGNEVPDKYDVAVTFKVEHGKFEEEKTSLTEYVAQKEWNNEQQTWVEIESPTLTEDQIPSTITADPGYDQDSGAWEDPKPDTTTVIKEATEYTYTFEKADIGYRVEYYLEDEDGYSDQADHTISGLTAKFESEVTSYPEWEDLPENYVVDKVENLPLTIGSDASQNVIKVYYSKDENGNEVPDKYDVAVTFKVEHGKFEEEKDKLLTEYVAQKEWNNEQQTWVEIESPTLTEDQIPSTITADPGYDQDSGAWEDPKPDTTTVIKEATEYTYTFEKADIGYRVEYYLEDEDGYSDQADHTISGLTAKFESEVTSYPEWEDLPENYVVDKVENLPLTIGSDASQNVIKVYYSKDENGNEVPDKYDVAVTFKVEHGKFEEEKTSLTEYVAQKEWNNEQQTWVEIESPTLTEDQIPSTITADPGYDQDSGAWEDPKPDTTTVIKEATEYTYTFEKADIGYRVEYYLEDEDGYSDQADHTISGLTAKFESEVTSYPEWEDLPENYVVDKVENLPLTIGSDASQNVIKVYYSKDENGNEVPDKYDVAVTFKVEHGKFEEEKTSLTEYVAQKEWNNEQQTWVEIESPTLTEDQIPSTITADPGYDQDSGAWEDPKPDTTTVIKEATEYTYTFDRDYSLISISKYDSIYDGKRHNVTVNGVIEGEDTVTYSLDNNNFYSEEEFEQNHAPVDVTSNQVVYVKVDNGSTSHVYGLDDGSSVNITKKEVTVTTPDATKVFDGTPLTKSDGASVDGIIDGETYGFEVTGSQTTVDSSENTYKLTFAENGNEYTAKAMNYEIIEDLGTLTVTPQSIDPGEDPDNPDPSYKDVTVNTPSNVTYDGSAHQWKPTVTSGNTTLTEGQDYTVSYDKSDFTNVTGEIKVTITGTGNYRGTVTRTYQINPRAITLTSAGGTKTYDGTALTNGTVTITAGSLANPSDLTYRATGSQTEVGSSLNYIDVEFSSAQMEANYTVTLQTGTLTVNAAPVTPATPTPTPGGGDEGTGTDTTPTAGGPVAVADEDADAEEEPEEEEVEDEETPLSDGEEDVDDGKTPLAKIDVWALINLIAAIVTVLLGLILLLSKRHKNDDEEDEEERQARIERGEEKEQEQKRGWICKVLGVLVAIGSVVLFILTEDMSLPMAMTDEWTIWMIIIAVVELVLLLVGRHWKDVDDDEEEQAQA